MSLNRDPHLTALAAEVVALVRAAMSGDDLRARQWVKDALRERLDMSTLPPPPESFNRNERATYAGLTELFSERAHRPPPSWTKAIGPAESPVYLDSDAAKSAKLRAMLERNAPEPLKRRQVYAVRDYLDVL